MGRVSIGIVDVSTASPSSAPTGKGEEKLGLVSDARCFDVWLPVPARSIASTPERSIHESLREYARGIAGGLMFSLPLLYTMEVWWAGFTIQPERLIVYVFATFTLLLGYNRFAGMRHDATWLEVAIDSIEEMGLGLLLAAFMLFLLGRIAADMTASEILGKVVMEAMTVAIGVSVGTAQLGGGGESDKQDQGLGMVGGDGAPHFGGQLVIGFCGAMLFAANVAPTEEIMVIAHSIDSWRLLGLALFSLASSGLILFFSEFRGAKQSVTPGGWPSVLGHTLLAYSTALVASSMILWFFGRFDGEPLITCVGQIIILGVAGALGASAGRLLLQ